MDITRHLRDHEWKLVDRDEAREITEHVRTLWHCNPIDMKLLTLPGETYKFSLGDVPIAGVSMLPHKVSDLGVNMCPNATPGCIAACINTSGRGAMSTVHNGRGWKTDLLVNWPNVWYTKFCNEVANLIKLHPNARVRPNVFSDVHWEKLFPDEFWERFAKVRFQDYTKGWRRGEKVPFPKNYRVVFSASERTSVAAIRRKVDSGERVAVVLDVKKGVHFPQTWHGMPLVDGDVDDDLWSRPAGSVIGLRAKGKLKQQDSAFKRKVA